MLRFAGIPLALALAVALAGGATASHHEDGEKAPEPTLEWDQGKMTALATRLAGKMKGLRDNARNRPPDNIASGQAAARMRVMDDLRLLEGETRHLAGVLGEGEGRDETRPIFERIDELRRSAAEQARRMFLAEKSIDQIQAAREIIEEMRPYYGTPPDPNPDL